MNGEKSRLQQVEKLAQDKRKEIWSCEMTIAKKRKQIKEANVELSRLEIEAAQLRCQNI